MSVEKRVNKNEKTKCESDSNNNIVKELFVIGDEVLVKNFKGKKLDDLFLGPYKVSEVSNAQKWIRIVGSKEWIHFNDVKKYEIRSEGCC